MNPLLDFAGLPKFHAITPEIVKPAIEELIADAERVVAKVTGANEAPTWANVVTPIDDVTERLGRAWGVVGHLNAVVNSPALRDVYNGMLPTITQFWTQLSQNEALFAKYKQIRASSDTFAANGTPVGDFGGALTAAQIRSLDNEIRDFRLGGAELSAEKKTQFQAIQEELSTLMSKFNDNVLDATNAFAYVVVDQSELAGLPADAIEAARESAKADGQAGWKFTLQAPSYMPVMQYADHQPLRELMYRAYVTRASELGAKIEWDNSAVIKRILERRKESAALLGYNSYAEVSLAAKMAETPNDVVNFLNEMAAKSRPFAEQDWQELKMFAREQFNMAEVNAWDVGYVSEKLRQQRYAFSDNDVKQYFPESKVIAGLFRVVESIYGVTFAKASAETWHADVQFYDVRDKDGTLIGQFYFDLYARENKRGGAWMDDAINRRRAHGKLQHPVAFMTCNFPAPVGGRAALFTHDDVITLFHEFGHGLHQLLTEVDELGVSGINGVEWDAVELPSQFMENFCWEWDVLRHMTAHVETGEALPRALFDKMIAAKNFQAGMQFLRQIEFALFDMQSHIDFDPTNEDIIALVRRVREQVAVVQYPSFNRMPHAFSHIFGGGYAAGYYSYKWAEVLSADAYAAFEESGVLNQETGAKFRREVLARGGSRPAMESFIAFRGRKPEIEHLLRHNGMKLAA
ncbi:oligopeptidase A [Betaproteobacteria bacterium UKL13-2]|nr:oligopeptidase A [Betaproteobacteria bacterium UKL13-2]HCG53914.1 oligopeptidase A [Betaproteobacteria bacterium]